MSGFTRLNNIGDGSPAIAGAAFMILASAFLAGMHGSVRYVSSDLHPFVIAFFRNVFGFCVLLPWLIRIGLIAFRTEQLELHAVRGVLNGGSMLCWFTGLSLIPLADATALSLTSPLFVTFGAILVLGERIRFHRVLALGIGLAGMLVILQPGFAEITLGALLVVGSAGFVSCSKLIAKQLTRTESTATIVAYLTLLMIPVTAMPAALVWQSPNVEQLAILVLIGTLGSGGHICFIQAYRLADVGMGEPMILFRLVWASVLGFLVFAEVPGIEVWIGGAMIVAATSYVARRESRSDTKS